MFLLLILRYTSTLNSFVSGQKCEKADETENRGFMCTLLYYKLLKRLCSCPYRTDLQGLRAHAYILHQEAAARTLSLEMPI